MLEFLPTFVGQGSYMYKCTYNSQGIPSIAEQVNCHTKNTSWITAAECQRQKLVDDIYSDGDINCKDNKATAMETKQIVSINWQYGDGIGGSNSNGNGYSNTCDSNTKQRHLNNNKDISSNHNTKATSITTVPQFESNNIVAKWQRRRQQLLPCNERWHDLRLFVR